jgi:hypothetical protein
MRYLLALCLALWATTTNADITPDQVLEMYPLYQHAQCEDNETGDKGTCFMFKAGEDFYLVFVQEGKPVFMRYIKPPNPYVEVWRAPQGVSL